MTERCIPIEEIFERDLWPADDSRHDHVENCPRCQLGLANVVLRAGQCPACRFPVLPKMTLVLPDGTRIDIPPEGLTIGRDLVSANPAAHTVSRRHVRIFYDSDSVLCRRIDITVNHTDLGFRIWFCQPSTFQEVSDSMESNLI